MAEWMSRAKANAFAQDNALRLQKYGLSPGRTKAVSIGTNKSTPAKSAGGENKPVEIKTADAVTASVVRGASNPNYAQKRNERMTDFQRQLARIQKEARQEEVQKGKNELSSVENAAKWEANMGALLKATGEEERIRSVYERMPLPKAMRPTLEEMFIEIVKNSLFAMTSRN